MCLSIHNQKKKEDFWAKGGTWEVELLIGTRESMDHFKGLAIRALELLRF